MNKKANRSKTCWQGKVYLGSRDPFTSNPWELSPKDWVEVQARDIESFKKKLSELASSRYRAHDRAKVRIMNHIEQSPFVFMTRHNTLDEFGNIQYGLWMIG